MSHFNLLFLCTGNYYRSRFAEEYFNHHCKVLGLPWRADSRGLAERVDAFPQNVGPISDHALRHLQSYQVEPRGATRFPVRVEAEDLIGFDRVIALSREEHEPMVMSRFSGLRDRVEYFEIGDLHIESADAAIPRLAQHLNQLIADLAASLQAKA